MEMFQKSLSYSDDDDELVVRIGKKKKDRERETEINKDVPDYYIPVTTVCDIYI
jgi:hypothetical protein